MKTYFSLFANDDGDKAKETKFKKYTGKDAAGKAMFDEVTADYRATNTDDTVTGSALKDKSQAGHTVIRVNIAVKDADGKSSYMNMTLNHSKQKKSEKAPDYFGTASGKGDVEFDVAGWLKQDKNGKNYLSCLIQDQYQKPAETAAAPASAPIDDDDSIPF